MSVLLVSTYDLGRQPFGLASPAAWLRRVGLAVHVADLSRGRLAEDAVRQATFVAFYLPMHTATRLALPIVERVRALNPRATICAFGLYAPLNERLLRSRGVSIVLGPEFEADLVAVASAAAGRSNGATGDRVSAAEVAEATEAASRMRPLARLQFVQPDRTGLPGLDRYAALQMPDGSRRLAGATDTTRGCKHRCRHCPIVPVYDGAFRVVSPEVVLADIRAQVAQGARHITFGDPDFFNGPTHARRIVEALHAEWPELGYDATIKVEHLLRHRDLLPKLVETGCLFVTTAVESIDDAVLANLEKGHTRADFVEVVHASRQAGLALSPTFVAFTPWTTLAGCRELLETVEALGLVEHVAPVQWSIRLLITEGSRLLELEDIRARVNRFDRTTLTYPWQHDDPRVDGLQQRIMAHVGVRPNRPRSETFEEIRRIVADAEGPTPAFSSRSALPVGSPCTASTPILPSRAAIPYLNEPWYC